MAIRVALHHCTSYQYDRYVTLTPQVMRLRPAPHCRTPVLGYSLCIRPREHFLNWQQDPHGNFLARAVFPKPTKELTIEVDLVAELTVINPFDFFLEDEVTEFPFTYAQWLDTELAAYRTTLPLGRNMDRFLRDAPRSERRTIDLLVALNRYVHEAVRYVIRLEPGVQTCEETLEKKSGSCRDSAWLLAQLLRHIGFATRFVSGYLIQLTPDVKSLDGPSGTDHDFTDLHAWTEVYLPGAGWIGLDPTSGLLTGEGHLPLAATPDPASAAPLTGGVSESQSELHFSMSVKRIHEDPRVTKPYTEEQWSHITTLGHKVDALLEANDVRLTMGGEPTFVSSDNMDGPEWNFTALGEEKRKLAGELLERLEARFGSGSLLHFGQGKWYPGEQLPRWALGCYWRKDRQPIWHNPALIARDLDTTQFTSEHAATFIRELAEVLEVDPNHAQPGFEDAWYYLWRERRLPGNVDPHDAQLDDPQERARLARVYEQGLKTVIGYALPLRPTGLSAERSWWTSGAWFFRAERMYLIPGDSAMGYRLPLDSLLWWPERESEWTLERDPLEVREALALRSRAGMYDSARSTAATRATVALQRRIAEAASLRDEQPVALLMDEGDEAAASYSRTSSPGGNGQYSANGADHPQQVIRTALCVEARQGRLHVFMPPLGKLEHYLHLIEAVEATADRLHMPVRIEGYPPPYDPRITHFKVTPDPGVIEVNLQPVQRWEELVETTTTLYDEARLTRLGTEKFMLDGRHTGTGGGNHFVLGGATPLDSPFLRRPDLLQSLVTYWNNHPSLSYLFSGLFVGPTSQAPRVDEARHESVYELETAFAQLPRDGTASPWLVDRVLRHLLVDLTGNTHRAEFCIDKLFSPDSSSGRLGLVEFRAFEMPPHARMSLAQQLLLRALVVRFWQRPYRQQLVRWGTALHDRFLLPHFLALDFEDVIDDLTEQGFPFERDWFAPHFEFRFPLIGRLTKRNVQLEIRQAIEPWHVLGEEGSTSGTSRYVDSSVERVQVKVRGLTDTRHILAANGRRVPLVPTDTPGEFVAGVRFRAWQPPSCLHPTIGIHSPLVFDLVDTWNQRIIGGCTWHVAHPGGRSFERFPVNAYEAESRRMARFFPFGHRCGKLGTLVEEKNRDYPCTLDLRRAAEPASLDG